MKKIARVIVITSFLTSLLLVQGCGSLSLFSSRHVHYHAGPEADKKIGDLEKRVEVLEKKLSAKE